jgi:hypothetical protein
VRGQIARELMPAGAVRHEIQIIHGRGVKRGADMGMPISLLEDW